MKEILTKPMIPLWVPLLVLLIAVLLMVDSLVVSLLVWAAAVCINTTHVWYARRKARRSA